MSKRTIGGLAALAGIIALAWFILAAPRTAPQLTTTTATRESTADELPALPEPVRATYRDLLAAADAQSFEQLQAIIDRNPDKQIKYSFGMPDESATVWWQQHEDKEKFFRYLLEVLKTDYAFQDDMVVWPSFFVKSASEATPDEVEQWKQLAGQRSYDEAISAQSGYMGYRLAIGLDGHWRFYIAGD